MRVVLLLLSLIARPAAAGQPALPPPAGVILIDDTATPDLPHDPADARRLLALLDLEARLQQVGHRRQLRWERRWRRQLARAVAAVDADTPWAATLDERQRRYEARGTTAPATAPRSSDAPLGLLLEADARWRAGAEPRELQRRYGAVLAISTPLTSVHNLALLQHAEATWSAGDAMGALSALEPLANGDSALAPNARALAAAACLDLADARDLPPLEACRLQPVGVLMSLAERLAELEDPEAAVDVLEQVRDEHRGPHAQQVQTRIVQLLRQATWPDGERLSFEERELQRAWGIDPAELPDAPAPAALLSPRLLDRARPALLECRDAWFPRRPVGRVDLRLAIGGGLVRQVDIDADQTDIPGLATCIAEGLAALEIPDDLTGEARVGIVFLTTP